LDEVEATEVLSIPIPGSEPYFGLFCALTVNSAGQRAVVVGGGRVGTTDILDVNVFDLQVSSILRLTKY